MDMTAQRQRADFRQQRKELITSAYDSLVASHEERGVPLPMAYQMPTVRDVACECGISVGAVYLSFKSKDAIISELYEADVRRK